ncbi:hypothetical protein [Streptomyces tagetis]|uniref:Uncharacterized protein n=1 Tax=Streptomyces tagetis TaxID=2820809 RepID=A0A941AXJ3_9ACTN|nr:hypothetical protein [Streptomyces sp. RG38]MBQ0826254.1 hypothetical protein [Streptomyces sp. RG38]
MTDHRLEGPGENGSPVPRDMQDQQAGSGEDPWEAAPKRAAPTRRARTEESEPHPDEQGEREERGEPGEPGVTDESEGADESPTAGGPGDPDPDPGSDTGPGPAPGPPVPDGPDVPDTDEAGTGRQGAPHSGAVHPEHPVPDESPG